MRKETIKHSKDFILQSKITKARSAEEIVAVLPAVEKAFNLLGIDKDDLSTEKESQKILEREPIEKLMAKATAKRLRKRADNEKQKLSLEE